MPITHRRPGNPAVAKVVTLTAAACVAACIATPNAGPDTPQPLQEFTGASQFLLPGLSSYSFAIEQHNDARDADRIVAVRVASAGTNFERPANVGFGKYDGIRVEDFGANGLGAAIDTDLGEPTTRIAGAPVWFVSRAVGAVSVQEAYWWTHVDQRYVVTASNREFLERALTRSGDLRKLLRPFPALHYVAPDADYIVCVLPRPDNTSYPGRLVPTEVMVTAVCTQSQRVQVLHRSDLPRDYESLISDIAVRSSRTSHSVGDWTTTEMRMRESVSDIQIRIVLATVFGVAPRM